MKMPAPGAMPGAGRDFRSGQSRARGVARPVFFLFELRWFVYRIVHSGYLLRMRPVPLHPNRDRAVKVLELIAAIVGAAAK